MKNILLTLSLSLVSLSSFAQNTIEVNCWTQIQNKKQVISLRLDNQGKLVYWAKNQIAKTDKKSIFGILAENVNKFGFEFINSIQAPNGYSIIQAGTTADAISIGVSKDLTKGFYSYRDHGSGNGNQNIVLACSKK